MHQESQAIFVGLPVVLFTVVGLLLLSGISAAFVGLLLLSGISGAFGIFVAGVGAAVPALA